MLHPSMSYASFHAMRPLRPVYVAILVAQTAGATAGLWLAAYPSWLENVWAGAALATFPGYLAGWVVQKHVAAAALESHGNTVRRIGFAALVLSLAALFTPFGR